MKHDTPKQGRAGETSQWPRWEGPATTRPRGFLQGEANIYADDPEGEKKRTASDYPSPEDLKDDP
ncbi:hypothetical protein [Rhizobium oryzicola]|uniref:Uncharacterized protein n=1 Tax=Rhizobium oryzicola TaxID=1232668 RepID=A0ABT8T0S8_9HYPH|nr:hypothetical protein [Rhizobium oryzicola]MDO1584248.1 hypothetical protein [Rhizobium oryzicola]